MGNKWCASCKSQSQLLLQKQPAAGNPSEDRAERTGARAKTRDVEAQPVTIATTLTEGANERKLVAESEIQLQEPPSDEKGLHLARIDFSSSSSSPALVPVMAGGGRSVPSAAPAPPPAAAAPSSSVPRKISFKDSDANMEPEEDEEEEEEEEEEREAELLGWRRTQCLSPLPKMEYDVDERERWQEISEEIEMKATDFVNINIFIAAKVLYPALERFRQEQIQTRHCIGEEREQLMR